MIQFAKVTTDQEEIDAVSSVIASGWLAPGPETGAFEKDFSDYISPPGEHYHCIFTNSCTSALKMAYKWAKENVSEVEDGFDGIVSPRNTFCATYSAAKEMGLDVNFHDEWFMPGKFFDGYYGINMSRVNVHYGGIKDETQCLIEDSAHRIEPNDPLVGKIRCYSFYATKNMTTGAGGMFVTNDDAIYERARLFWKDGLTTSTADRLNGIQGYEVKAMAGGYDATDMAAAMGRVQLRKLPLFTQRRNEIVDYYNDQLGGTWGGNHLYPVMLDSVDEVYTCIAYMRDQGVACGYHYPGTGWKGVSLPLYPLLTDSEVEHIIDAVRGYRATRI